MPAESEKLDSFYVDARREAIGIIVIFSLFAVFSLTVSLWLGWEAFTRDQLLPAADVGHQTVLGMPKWVFWGVFAPWVVACLVSVWFAFFFMKDGALDESEVRPDDTEQTP